MGQKEKVNKSLNIKRDGKKSSGSYTREKKMMVGNRNVLFFLLQGDMLIFGKLSAVITICTEGWSRFDSKMCLFLWAIKMTKCKQIPGN